MVLALTTVILGPSSGARNVGHNAAIAIGGHVALPGLWANPVSGASMNRHGAWILRRLAVT